MTFSQRNVLITGASSGLGLAVSKRFAQLGANVILLCQTEESADRAVAQIREEAPNASLRPMICDLASMASVNGFISGFLAEYETLDLLFNNAAVMKRRRTVTDDGFEMMFQVNYLAPFILMTSLLDRLSRSPIHLVINNALPSEKVQLDFDDLQSSQRYRMYGSFFETKLCLLLASLELAQRPESSGVSVLMIVPGRPFKSALVRDVPWPIGWFKNLFSAKVETAAEDILFVAQSNQARTTTGQAFKGRQRVPLAPSWQDATIRKRLWDDTEAMIERSQRRLLQ
jgi:NAD(P)-dependent dehydrogenase (short-subunit alcohol dehydrogenase family)